jgi:transcriptional regulator with XRE-family HTH domain|uniref:helix-turn-helix domain-containing protein n=1 Tax=Orrella sp. TaxID=1921583 RepID=UPI004048336B
MNFTLSLPSEILDCLAERLRTQRLAQSLSQSELAQKTGLSLGAIKKLERDGQSSLDTFVKVVSALRLAQELEPLFVMKIDSIAQMERAFKLTQRKRAPRRTSS